MFIEPTFDNGFVLTTVKHGMTKASRDRIIAGRHDTPLIDLGREQAREVASELSAIGCSFDMVISSPLSRAIETARILLQKEPAYIVEACTERSFGRMETVPEAELSARFPGLERIQVGAASHTINPPEGESLEQLSGRAASFLDFLLSFRQPGVSRILVVSHHSFLQQLHGQIMGLCWKESLRQDIQSLEVSQFEFNNVRRLVGKSLGIRLAINEHFLASNL